MSGTIPLSMTQQFDIYGQPLKGGQLFVIQAGTVATPQNPYQDAALTLVLPNPITLDAAGRIPQFFLADGYIKIRLADVNGVTQLAADGILVIGPSAGGGGGGGGVDATTVLQTGDVKPRYDTSVVNGFVRANGRSIGSSASGATELADPSAQALFNYLWNKDQNLAVTPSRGASSAADWAANKQLALPDFRGCALGGLDGMGNALAGRLPPAVFASADVLGSLGGNVYAALSAGNLPPHSHNGSGTTGTDYPDHTHGYSAYSTYHNDGTQALDVPVGLYTAQTTGANTRHQHNFSFTTDGGNGLAGSGFAAFGPRKLLTIYIKL
jgi:microcystin-dependent protein